MTNSKPTVALRGYCYDDNSSFLRGPAEAPPIVRETLFSPAYNSFAESGVDFASSPFFGDEGDLLLNGNSDAMGQIEQDVTRLLNEGKRLLAIGGDHAITYPIIKAYAAKFEPLTLVHIDAHPDMYDDFEGNPFSHASPFARIMEAGLVGRLIQIGIRTLNDHQRQQIERFGAEVHEMRDWTGTLNLLRPIETDVYLSVDLDGIDPAFAPGVSHQEPGGLTSREVLTIIQGIPTPIVGADVVEFNPTRDPSGITAALAAKLVKEMAGALIGA